MSRKLSPDFRIQAYSTEELVNEWESTATGLCQGRKLLGLKLKPGPLLDGIVLWFLEQGREDREQIVSEAVRLLEKHLEEPEAEVKPPHPARVPVVNSAPKRKARR